VSDVLQARYLIVELERVVDQIDTLERLTGGHLEATRRRQEFHGVGRQIDAPRRRFVE
jgi:hypothetical protein